MCKNKKKMWCEIQSRVNASFLPREGAGLDEMYKELEETHGDKFILGDVSEETIMCGMVAIKKMPEGFGILTELSDDEKYCTHWILDDAKMPVAFIVEKRDTYDGSVIHKTSDLPEVQRALGSRTTFPLPEIIYRSKTNLKNGVLHYKMDDDSCCYEYDGEQNQLIIRRSWIRRFERVCDCIDTQYVKLFDPNSSKETTTRKTKIAHLIEQWKVLEQENPGWRAQRESCEFLRETAVLDVTREAIYNYRTITEINEMELHIIDQCHRIYNYYRCCNAVAGSSFSSIEFMSRFMNMLLFEKYFDFGVFFSADAEQNVRNIVDDFCLSKTYTEQRTFILNKFDFICTEKNFYTQLRNHWRREIYVLK